MANIVVIYNIDNYKILLKNSDIKLENLETTWFYMTIWIPCSLIPLKLKTKGWLTFRHHKDYRPETVITKMNISPRWKIR